MRSVWLWVCVLACGPGPTPVRTAPVRHALPREAEDEVRCEVLVCFLMAQDAAPTAIDAGSPAVQERLLQYAAEHGRSWLAPEGFGFSSHRMFRFGRALVTYEGGVWMLVERVDNGAGPIRFLANFEKYYGHWSYSPPGSSSASPPPAALALFDVDLR